jgi:hypothetical protein
MRAFGQWERRVPELSRFFGIIAAMYYNDHAPPHFHAKYGGDQASIRIDNGEILEGSLTPRAIRLVEEWGVFISPNLSTTGNVLKPASFSIASNLWSSTYDPKGC